jgi:site-specific DNA recombinase
MRACGYTRVSSDLQAGEDKTSLEDQEQSIKTYIKSQNWTLTKIYSDEGLSGADENREDLQNLLSDADRRVFDIAVVDKTDRLARDLYYQLYIIKTRLKPAGVDLKSVREGYDLNTYEGVLQAQIFGSISEFERKRIRDRMVKGRISGAKKGFKSVGKIPYARLYDKEKREFSLDPEKVEILKWAANEYISGRSLTVIAEEIEEKYGRIGLRYDNLLRVLSERCGDTWEINFMDEKEPIFLPIPRILDEATIQQVKDVKAHNKCFENRKAVEDYPLAGYLRCASCRRALSGQLQHRKYKYYRHPLEKDTDCKDFFSYIKAGFIEDKVFTWIFQHTDNKQAFEKATKESLPDALCIKGLKDKISWNEKKLKKVENDLERLVENVIEGRLRKETIKPKEDKLYKEKESTEERLEILRSDLGTLPDIEEVKAKGELLRKFFLNKYSKGRSLKRFQANKMSFEEKKEIIHWLFDGKDDNGKPWGIYLKRVEKGKWIIDIHARLTYINTLQERIILNCQKILIH